MLKFILNSYVGIEDGEDIINIYKEGIALRTINIFIIYENKTY